MDTGLHLEKLPSGGGHLVKMEIGRGERLKAVCCRILLPPPKCNPGIHIHCSLARELHGLYHLIRTELISCANTRCLLYHQTHVHIHVHIIV